MMKENKGMAKRIFEDIYERNDKATFEKQGSWHEQKRIDEMAAFTMRSYGGFVWVCKNYDGDIQSERVAQDFGSTELMSSVLLTLDGKVMLCESNHAARLGGTSTSPGKPASNTLRCVCAWIRGLLHRAKLDDNFELKAFAENL